MKKKYIYPSITIAEIKLQQLIATSIPVGGDGDAGGAESRRRGRNWKYDDEEEEEFY